MKGEKDIFRSTRRSSQVKDRFFAAIRGAQVEGVPLAMYRDFRRGTKCPGAVITHSLCNYTPV